MTGQQVAQLYNPDPFALPIWRAPVYRTPAGIMLLVQLVRLLAWLVRLIARHPLAASIVALLALIWVNLGWPGVVALAACAVLILATWRYFWPRSFARLVAGPARGRWRAWWYYRRRWAGVMAISGVAPWHRGQVILPMLGKVTATRYTDRVAVRLVSGQARPTSPSARRSWRTGSARCCAGSVLRGLGGWCWSSSAGMPWPPSCPPCRYRVIRI